MQHVTRVRFVSRVELSQGELRHEYTLLSGSLPLDQSGLLLKTHIAVVRHQIFERQLRIALLAHGHEQEFNAV